MGFNRFRLEIILRSVFLGATIWLAVYLAGKELVFTSALLAALVLLEIYFLIHFVEKTNRDLTRFFNSIKFSDFSQSFNEKNYGSSFKSLHDSINNVIDQFKKTRSEMEEHFQYLQTTVKHINIGLISYKENGDIQLLNDAAKELLGIDEIKNINQLSPVNNQLVDELRNIETGKKSLVKINVDNKVLQLSIAAAKFMMRGRKFTLVSLQDISSELERERMYNELEIAREVQFKMLPKQNPVVPGYLISSMCTPALEVGGDYYDFIRLDKNRLGIVIADVAGKGLPAAIYMTLTKGAFQSYAASSSSPKEVLTKLNSLIYNTIERGNFITLFYAVLDFEKDKLTFARAGHEPVIHFNKKDDGISLLKPVGIGLGLEEGKIFSRSIEEDEIDLSNGDSLLFITDGITESKNETSSDFGMINLIEVIKKFNISSSNSKPEELLNKLSNEIKHFRKNAPQYDDMTAIAIVKEPSTEKS